MKNILFIFLIAVTAIFVAGCSSTKEVKKEEVKKEEPKKEEVPPLPPPVVKKPGDPDLVLRIASINLANFTKRIEIQDIEALNSEVQKQKIDILTLQGVNRYPEVTTRIDIIDSLGARCDMRQVFGETIEISGKQHGNAVLSTYTIRSSENTHYEGLSSNNFEAALQAVVDCGVRDVIIVSTELPEPLIEDDKRIIGNKMSSFGIQYLNDPMIITGNLPNPDELRTTAQYVTLKPMSFDSAPRIWYSVGNALKLISQSIESTALGAMTVAEFGLFRKPGP